MSEFKVFKTAVQTQFKKMTDGNNVLFITSVDVDKLWEKYLDSFPEGTNPIYKERREYDCNYCKSFIRHYGNIVVVDKDFNLVSIWDIDCNDDTFTTVAKALSEYVKSFPISEAFISKEKNLGVDKNHAETKDGKVIKWEHFYFELPKSYVNTNSKSIETIRANLRDNKNVFTRSMKELTLEAGKIIVDLIDQKSLYRGEEFLKAIKGFISYKEKYNKLSDGQKDNWGWVNSFDNPVVRIRNTAIGTLLIDISNGLDLNESVSKFEKVVAPTNYKRPNAIFTKKMVEDAQNKIVELGYENSLERRHATFEDITVNNIIFANRDARKKMKNSPFDDLKDTITDKPKNLDKVEEITIEDFITKVVPTTSDIEIMMENKHMGNLMSLIAPVHKDSKTMFKWDNNFSWCYNGDIADSMKQRVKEAGGKVDGVLRFSIQWNENKDNNNDYDAHCIEPNGNHIYFGNPRSSTGGNLDVDIRIPNDKVAVENITFPLMSSLRVGEYKFYVHNYSHRGGVSGFSAEIEFDGQIFHYEYNRDVKAGENVIVALVTYNKTTGFTIKSPLSSTTSSKEVWGIATNKFQRVSSVMYSPNYWDDQKGTGNKHYFFIVDGCKNESTPRGFFNEFLKEDLLEHRKVFEALGSKMRVEDSNDQMSGLGFSSTQKSDVIVKVKGSFNRMLKIIF